MLIIIVVSRQPCRGAGNGSLTGVVCVWGGGGEGGMGMPSLNLPSKYATKGRHGEHFESYFFNPIATSTG